jgi:hypothetical protein
MLPYIVIKEKCQSCNPKLGKRKADDKDKDIGSICQIHDKMKMNGSHTGRKSGHR